MTGEWRTLSFEEIVARFIADGYTDAELYGWFTASAWTRLWTRNQFRELVADIRGRPTSAPSVWWVAMVAKYDQCGERPPQHAVARKMGYSEEQFRRYMRAEGVTDWRHVHARIAAERS